MIEPSLSESDFKLTLRLAAAAHSASGSPARSNCIKMIDAAAALTTGRSASTAAGRPGRGLSRLTRKQLARLAAV